MLVEQCPTQPKTAGCLFRLPFELRQMIWEMVIFNLSPRICPLSYDGVNTIKQYQTRQVLGIGVDPLFVYDCPKLRYICRDICHETTPLYTALGWRFDGQGPPKRRYDPDVDILYPQLNGFSQFLSRSRAILTQLGSESPLSVAAVQVRNARHIAIGYSLGSNPHPHTYQEIKRCCPHIKRISVVMKDLPEVDIGRKPNERWGRRSDHSCLDLPMRPCTLVEAPSFPSPEKEGIEATLANYARRYHIKKAYSKAAREYIGLSRRALAGLPTPQSAIPLHMIGPSTTGEGEEWEEVELDYSGHVIKTNRSVGV